MSHLTAQAQKLAEAGRAMSSRSVLSAEEIRDAELLCNAVQKERDVEVVRDSNHRPAGCALDQSHFEL